MRRRECMGLYVLLIWASPSILSYTLKHNPEPTTAPGHFNSGPKLNPEGLLPAMADDPDRRLRGLKDKDPLYEMKARIMERWQEDGPEQRGEGQSDVRETVHWPNEVYGSQENSSRLGRDRSESGDVNFVEMQEETSASDHHNHQEGTLLPETEGFQSIDKKESDDDSNSDVPHKNITTTKSDLNHTTGVMSLETTSHHTSTVLGTSRPGLDTDRSSEDGDLKNVSLGDPLAVGVSRQSVVITQGQTGPSTPLSTLPASSTQRGQSNSFSLALPSSSTHTGPEGTHEGDGGVMETSHTTAPTSQLTGNVSDSPVVHNITADIDAVTDSAHAMTSSREQTQSSSTSVLSARVPIPNTTALVANGTTHGVGRGQGRGVSRLLGELILGLLRKQFTWVDIIVTVCCTMAVALVCVNVAVVLHYLLTRRQGKMRVAGVRTQGPPSSASGSDDGFETCEASTLQVRPLACRRPRPLWTISPPSPGGATDSSDVSMETGILGQPGSRDSSASMIASFVNPELIGELNDRDSACTTPSDGFVWARDYGDLIGYQRSAEQRRNTRPHWPWSITKLLSRLTK